MDVPASATIQRARHLFLSSRARLTDQFGLVEQVVKPAVPLPEFLFFGSTNVGKSSLLTDLLNPPSKRPLTAGGTRPTKELPRVSKRAGFTATMSVYTVGNLLRLIDSPGYGYKSQSGQGDVATQYLDCRGDLIRQAYVLIHPRRGVGVQDKEVSAILAQYGIPFRFVITKCDRGASPTLVFNEYLELCKKLGVPPAAQQIMLTSSKRKYGIDELRGQILQLSGILEHRNVHNKFTK